MRIVIETDDVKLKERLKFKAFHQGLTVKEVLIRLINLYLDGKVKV